MLSRNEFLKFSREPPMEAPMSTSPQATLALGRRTWLPGPSPVARRSAETAAPTCGPSTWVALVSSLLSLAAWILALLSLGRAGSP